MIIPPQLRWVHLAEKTRWHFFGPELGDMPTKRGKRGRSSSNAPRKSKEASITASKNNTDGRNFANSDKTAVGIFVEKCSPDRKVLNFPRQLYIAKYFNV